MFGYVFFGRHTETVVKSISEVVSGEIEVLFEIMNSNKEIDAINMGKKMGISVEIINNEKLKNKGTAKKTRIYKILESELNKKKIKSFFISRKGKNIMIYIDATEKEAVYKMAFPKKRLYSNTTHVVIIWGAASGVIMLLIAFLFLKNQIRAVTRLANATVMFGRGIDIKLTPEGAYEIKQAGIAFGEMQTKIRKLLQERMIALAGISHDLRTPLTRMKLQLSMMDRTQEVKDLIDDVNLMTEITSSFLEFSKEQINEPYSSQNLFKILISFKIDKRKIKIIGDKNVDIIAKQTSFKRAIGNIISNAERFADKIFIYFEKFDSKIIIRIEDNGPGIQDSDIEKIFKPFISANNARTIGNQHANIGLGLTIAKDTIASHGGSITAGRSQLHGGALFEIILPQST